MTNEKKYTERDMVMAKREGFVDGCMEELRAKAAGQVFLPHPRSALLYPLPTVTRPRVVRFEEWGFRVASANRLEFTGGVAQQGWWDDTWTRFEYVAKRSPQLLTLWADLLENPTEEVEDDA